MAEEFSSEVPMDSHTASCSIRTSRIPNSDLVDENLTVDSNRFICFRPSSLDPTVAPPLESHGVNTYNALPLDNSRPKPHISKQLAESGVMGRLKEFLPQISQANAQLSNNDLMNIIIEQPNENISLQTEETEYISFDIGVGVFDVMGSVPSEQQLRDKGIIVEDDTQLNFRQSLAGEEESQGIQGVTNSRGHPLIQELSSSSEEDEESSDEAHE